MGFLVLLVVAVFGVTQMQEEPTGETLKPVVQVQTLDEYEQQQAELKAKPASQGWKPVNQKPAMVEVKQEPNQMSADPSVSFVIQQRVEQYGKGTYVRSKSGYLITDLSAEPTEQFAGK